jgi:uncharacterized protein
MIEQAGRGVFMFSTDIPHPEGGRDPQAQFAKALAATSPAHQDRFYAGNLNERLHGRPG